MKYDIYKLADQYALNEGEQQLLLRILEATDQGIHYSVR